MESLRLNDDLSYCEVDGRLIFLDIGSDRYFRLSQPLESSFVRYLQDCKAPNAGISQLVGQRILTEEAPGPPFTRSLPASPTHSALEMAAASAGANVAAAVEVAALVLSTHLQLRIRPLKRLLGRLRRRDGAPSIPALPSSGALALQAAACAEAFRCARMLVPINTRCLPDSIALTRFLARRQLFTDLVFGVTSDPFSAHCWVQYRGIVLNDTLDHIRAYTPILVI